MLASLRICAAASAVFFLGACFLSENQLIGEGARLQDGPLAFCIDPGEPCHQAMPSEDGYLILPHPEDAAEEDPMFARFMALPPSNGQQMWLGEVELRQEDEIVWAYIVAVSAGDTSGGVSRYNVAVPGCGDASTDQRLRYWLEEDGAYSCRIGDVAAFAEYLRERHSSDFTDPDWWDQN
ncbi:MAG: hypothetical protein ACK4MQ_02250 [Hyphomonas sp.]